MSAGAPTPDGPAREGTAQGAGRGPGQRARPRRLPGRPAPRRARAVHRRAARPRLRQPRRVLVARAGAAPGQLRAARQGHEDPVLILDDVFAELDAGRRDRLAGLVAGAEQVLITAAVPADVPDVLAGARFTSGRRDQPCRLTARGAPTGRSGWRPRRWPRPRRTRGPGAICRPASEASRGRVKDQRGRTVRRDRGRPRMTRCPPNRAPVRPGGGPAGTTRSRSASAIGGLLDRGAGSSGPRWARCSAAGRRSSATDLAAHTRPDSFADGELAVTADSTAWATQVRLLAPQLVRRLNAELGDGTVRRVKVRGPAPPRQRGGWRVPGGKRSRATRTARRAKTALAVGA